MDIEKMKRVNALARELRDHGIASDYEEAYRQAEKMIDSGLEHSVEEEISVKPLAVKEEVKQERGGLGGMMGYDALELKNLKDRMDNFEQQMSMVFMKMNEIIGEINRLEKKRMESPIEIRDKKELEEKQRELQTSLKKQEVEPHPRSGDYKPGDVSIEKMFYFGGR